MPHVVKLPCMQVSGVVKIMFPASGILKSRSDAAMETQEYGPEYGETSWVIALQARIPYTGFRDAGESHG